MQQTNVGKAMRYLVVALVLVSSFALFACGGGDGDGDGDGGGNNQQISNVDTTVALGANNAAMAGQLLQSLPPVNFPGNAFDPSITGTVTLDFPTASTFTLTGGNLPAGGVSGDLSFGSCTFTFRQLNGFTGITVNRATFFGTCQVRITANGVTVGGGQTGGFAVLILDSFTSSPPVAISVQIQSDGTLIIISGGLTVTIGITPGIITTGTGSTGTGGTP